MNIHGRIFINPSRVVPCCSFVEFHVERERIDICARTFVHTYTHADRIIVKQTIGNKRHSWMNDALEKLVRSDDAFGIAWYRYDRSTPIDRLRGGTIDGSYRMCDDSIRRDRSHGE